MRRRLRRRRPRPRLLHGRINGRMRSWEGVVVLEVLHVTRELGRAMGMLQVAHEEFLVLSREEAMRFSQTIFTNQ